MDGDCWPTLVKSTDLENRVMAQKEHFSGHSRNCYSFGLRVANHLTARPLQERTYRHLDRRRPAQPARLAACSRLARAMTRWNGVIAAMYARPNRLWQCTTDTTTSSLPPSAPARTWIASRKSR